MIPRLLIGSKSLLLNHVPRWSDPVILLWIVDILVFWLVLWFLERLGHVETLPAAFAVDLSYLHLFFSSILEFLRQVFHLFGVVIILRLFDRIREAGNFLILWFTLILRFLTNLLLLSHKMLLWWIIEGCWLLEIEQVLQARRRYFRLAHFVLFFVFDELIKHWHVLNMCQAQYTLKTCLRHGLHMLNWRHV